MAMRKPYASLSPADAGPAGPSVSDILRETRQSLGYELRDVATMLRIRYPYLLAIEEGRFADLPGAAYAVGFLRSYAEHLGLDPDAIATRYKEEAAGNLRRQQLYLPTPAPEGRIPGGTVLLGTLVLAGIVYGGWYYLSATDRSVVDLVPALPDRLVSLLQPLPYGEAPPPGAAPTEPASAPVSAPAAVPAPAAPAASTQVAQAPSATPAPAHGGASSVTLPPAAASREPATVPPKPSAGTAAAPPPAPAAPAAERRPAAVAAVPTPAPAPAPPAAVPLAAAPAPSMAPAAAPVIPPATAVVPPSDGEEDEAQEPTPLSQDSAVAALPPSARPAAPAAPAPPVPAAASAATKVYGSQNQTSRIQIRAIQDSWVQVRDREGELIFTRVLKPGELYRVPDRPGIRLRTGNAGGLVLVTDGAEGAPLGAVGQVMREVQLEPQGSSARTTPN